MRIFLVLLECFIIKISTEWILRYWQYKHNYIDTYLHIYALTFAQPHKNNGNAFLLKKSGTLLNAQKIIR